MPRDSSGNYTLPLGNPVVDGTIIDVNWANPTMNDIAVQLNNVLTRDGLLSPTTQFKLIDGTAPIPGLGFISQGDLGFYRIEPSVLGVSVGGTEVGRWTSAGYSGPIAYSINVKTNFGAVGNGVADDTLAIKNAFTFAATNGLRCYVPAGTYRLTGGIGVVVTNSIEVYCDPGAILKADPAFPVDTKMFLFTASGAATKKFIWNGGTLDGRAMPTKVAVAAPDILSVIGAGFNETLIERAFVIGNDTRAGTAGDSLLFLAESQNITVRDCILQGGVDAGIYISGDNAQTIGRRCHITGNYFSHTFTAFISKRKFEDHIVEGNFVTECNIGIVVGGEADPLLSGLKGVIANNVLKTVGRGIEARLSDGTVIIGNRVEDFGISFGGVITADQGIAVSGSSNCVVIGNHLVVKSFVPHINSAGVTIANRLFNAVNYAANDNIVDGNTFVGTNYGVREIDGLRNKIGGGNGFSGVVNTVALNASSSTTRSISGYQITGVAPLLEFISNSGAANSKLWRINSTATSLTISARNDDGSATAAGNVIQAERTGSSITRLLLSIVALPDFVDDAAAAAGGVVINQLYRTGSTIKIRVT